MREAMVAVTRTLVVSEIANIAVPQRTIVSGTGLGSSHWEMDP